MYWTEQFKYISQEKISNLTEVARSSCLTFSIRFWPDTSLTTHDTHTSAHCGHQTPTAIIARTIAPDGAAPAALCSLAQINGIPGPSHRLSEDAACSEECRTCRFQNEEIPQLRWRIHSCAQPRFMTWWCKSEQTRTRLEDWFITL